MYKYHIGDLVRVVRKTNANPAALGWNDSMTRSIGFTGIVKQVNASRYIGLPILMFPGTTLGSGNTYHADAIELETSPERIKRAEDERWIDDIRI
jgi:hypothetical protein